MLYSSGTGALVNFMKGRLGPEQPIVKRIEHSDPRVFCEDFIREELGFQKATEYKAANTENKPFARPRGPARKR
jgi:hypothetical protein